MAINNDNSSNTTTTTTSTYQKHSSPSKKKHSKIFCPSLDGREMIWLAEDKAICSPQCGVSFNPPPEPGTATPNVLVTSDGYHSTGERINPTSRKFRKQCGEKISADSWVMRDLEYRGSNQKEHAYSKNKVS